MSHPPKTKILNEGTQKQKGKITNTDGIPKKNAKSSVYATLKNNKENTLSLYLTAVYRLRMDMEDPGARK